MVKRNKIYETNLRKEIFVAKMQQFIIYAENLVRCQNRMD
jgi:hypothetical protein